jgi:Tol biopolymer transport system component/tRNA A-37 threonylcarbamoyl transferase component Bud32
MPLSPGTRLGPHEILEPLGAGGMGEVYRARDTRLDRTVALKVLPTHLSDNQELRQRFDREARTISQLSHPHICALYDVGHQDGIDYLVMEYLEGETLSDRLTKGPLPTEQVLRYGVQIADALDKAHRQGIVHRDLKPSNVMITRSGVKLLDFGLAKLRATGPSGAFSGVSALRTQTEATLTAQGTIVGTFPYMAPEQLEGREADARSDIFALGAVLYEMATGRKTFVGTSPASLIAAILGSTPPPISTVQPMTPPALDRVVKTCLEKDPEDRWQTAHDVKLELQWIAEGGSQVGLPAQIVARRRTREHLGWIVAAVLAAAGLSIGLRKLRQERPAPAVVRSVIVPPEKASFRFTGNDGGPFAISPDGRALAFVASDASGKTTLWVRMLDSLIARSLPGTENPRYPFWSPDNRSLGFFADGKLKRIDVAGGPALPICNTPDPRGGTWNKEGVILFEPQFHEPISRVSANGGQPTSVTRFDPSRRETTHRWPFFLPDGKHFLYFSGSHQTGAESELDAIFVASLDIAERPKLLVHARSRPEYASGYLLYVRQKTLFAQPFDLAKLALRDEPITLAESVQEDPGFFTAIFSASQSGTLAYQPAGAATGLTRLVWFDRAGKLLEALEESADYWDPHISPDGRRVVFVVGDPGDAWSYDFARKARTRLTFAPAAESSPVWSPDGSRIVFSSARSGGGDIYAKPVSGRSSDELLVSSNLWKTPTSFSRDGRLVLYDVATGSTARRDIWILSLSDRKASPLLATSFDEGEGAFSPDGRWIAYASDESGRYEIYVRSFPGEGGKWQVSTDGGIHPVWRADQKEIFYEEADGKLMAVDIFVSGDFESGTPKVLFQMRPKIAPNRNFDVSRDGQRILVNTPAGEAKEESAPVILVQSWTAAIKR